MNQTMEVRWRLPLAAVAGLALLVLAWRVAHFYPFMADDAFISLRYSQRLLAGHGLTWSDGPRVEGYTNLLWVLLCAALGRLVDPVLAARGLGVACTLVTLAALVYHAATSLDRRDRVLGCFLSAISFALAVPFAVWAVGGLEEPLLVALLAWAMVLVLQSLRLGSSPGLLPASLLPASLLLALATLTRADGLLYPVVIAAGLLAGRRGAGRPALRLLTLPVLAFAAQTVFRRLYYGEWVPNTAYVKVSFTLHRVVTGLGYVGDCLSSAYPLLLLAAAGLWCLWTGRTRRPAAILLACVIAGPSFCLAGIGGDIFPASRLFLPVLLAMCLCAAHASEWVWRLAPERQWVTRALLAGACLLMLAYLGQGRAAEQERWEWQNRTLALYLRRQLASDHALLVADAAGALPYFSGLDAIDPLGLNDRTISHTPSVQRGQGLAGHELANGRYVMDHHPDAIVFGVFGSRKLRLLSDLQIAGDPRFEADYELLTLRFTAPEPFTSEIFVRKALVGRFASTPEFVSSGPASTEIGGSGQF